MRLFLESYRASPSFLPVSSFGHDVIISDMLGMNRAGGLLLETMLHLGTLAAVFLCSKQI